MKKQIEAIISGKVQGVYFRASTYDKANEIGVKGFVRNEPDGTVYVIAEAEEILLNEFLQWLKKGPQNADVKNITIKEINPKGYKTFEIVYS